VGVELLLADPAPSASCVSGQDSLQSPSRCPPRRFRASWALMADRGQAVPSRLAHAVAVSWVLPVGLAREVQHQRSKGEASEGRPNGAHAAPPLNRTEAAPSA
jgi:hypothetical protein